MILEQVRGLPPHSVNDTFCSWEQKCPKGPKAAFIFTSSKNYLKDFFFPYHTQLHTCCVRIQIGLYKCNSLTKKQSNLGCKQTPDASRLWSAENSQTQRVLGTDWQSRQETRAFPRKLSCENEIHLWLTGWSWGEAVRSPSDSERLLWRKGQRTHLCQRVHQQNQHGGRNKSVLLLERQFFVLQFCLTVMKEFNTMGSIDVLLVFHSAKPETSHSGRIFPRFKICCSVCFRRLLKWDTGIRNQHLSILIFIMYTAMSTSRCV